MRKNQDADASWFFRLYSVLVLKEGSGKFDHLDSMLS